ETSPTLGSMVQKGKFAAWAAAVWVRALKSVDLPTLGRPTMPHLKPMENLGGVRRRRGETLGSRSVKSGEKSRLRGRGGAERTGFEAASQDGSRPSPGQRDLWAFSTVLSYSRSSRN